ncbi:relaxosome protein TraM, partial [Aeromonas salmonicida]
NAVIDEIKGLVEEDIQAGAHPDEVSFSSKTSMLLELGLRVYNLRRSEHAGSGHDEFDRMLLSGVLEAKYLTQFFNQNVGGGKWYRRGGNKGKGEGNHQERYGAIFP